MAYTTELVHAGTAPDTTLNGGINAAVTSIDVADGTGWPSPTGGQLAYAVIAPGTSAEEKITYGGRSSNTLTSVTRGADGTSAASHSTGDTIRHSLSAGELTEANYAVRQTVGKVTTAEDLLVATGANAFKRLAKGSEDTFLKVESGVLAYGAAYYPTGTDVPITDGGTGASDASTARTNLGLGTIATQGASSVAITGGSITGITDLAIADGGTGAGTAADARTNLGLVIGTDVPSLAALTALPTGVVDQDTVTSDQGAITTTVDITGMSITATLTSGRLYRWTVDTAMFSTNSDGSMIVQITDETGTPQLARSVMPGSTSVTDMKAVYYETGTGASVTRKARTLKSGGTGSCSTSASATAPTYFTLEDLGEAP